MHGSTGMVRELVSAVRDAVTDTATEVAVCPAAVHLSLALTVAGDSRLAIGAQNCSEQEQGAYTGEVAATMLSELGCQWVILGHSERRQYYSESDDLVAAKSVAARAAGLKPILCVGETLAEREQGRAEAVVQRQLDALLAAGLAEGDVIAYEPVWAIGTGVTATPALAQEMHARIRAYLAQAPGQLAGTTRLLYGGSVKPDNAAELFAQKDIDGGLVGGAALKAADFVAIVRASEA